MPALNAKTIASRLCASPSGVADARQEIPDKPGFYAWWIRPGALPQVLEHSHPDGGWNLLYVGIAPGRKESAQTLKTRVGGQHIGGNAGSSTFRLTLASLLFEERGWQPRRTKTKFVLSPEDNRELREWQHAQMGLCWTVVERPWRSRLEAEVIEVLEPPLNLAENRAHPFHPTVSAARERYRAAANS